MSFFSMGFLKEENGKIVPGTLIAPKKTTLGGGSSPSASGGGGGSVSKQKSQSIYTSPSGLSGKANIIRKQLYGK